MNLLKTRVAGVQGRGASLPCGAVRRPPPALKRISDLKQLGDVAVKGLDTDLDIDDLELRDVKAVSYVSRRRLEDADFDPNAVDAEGLPLVYNEQTIANYWGKRPGELASRWAQFAAISVPWLTRLANAVIQNKLVTERVILAREAVDNLERLGPTYIKLGQILSIRPDVLPPDVLAELSKLQDKITPFDTQQARSVVEAELGAPVDEIFSEFSEEPIAAASLAQVYRARVRATGEEVAVKVQRPGALATISKDLYVLRRAVGVYERLVKRFTAQTTDYQQLLSTFAEGLYTEMDFRNEALNSQRMAELLAECEMRSGGIVIPQPRMELTSRRVLTMQWINGVKLTRLPAEEVQQLIKIGQEAFLTQLLEVGFFHGDPHPGNLFKVTEGPDAGKLALLDFGLVAEIPARDRQAMVSAVIHLANRDWDALVTDFTSLGFLPRDADRALIIPVMERVLSPYLRGGGAKAYNFQALSADLLSATLEIPFSVPPYMSLLARSVATLEGIALVGDPGYQMVAQAYPFVVRKVLRNDSNGAARLLQELLYDEQGQVKGTRLGAILNAALGYVADHTEGFIDFDAMPQDGASVQEVAAFLLSEEARDLRPLLVDWLSGGLDLLLRDRLRKAYNLLRAVATPRLPFIGVLPAPPPPPVFVPGLGLQPVERVVDLLAPPLDESEQVYLKSLTQLAASITGVEVSTLEAPTVDAITSLIANPSAQVNELVQALGAVAGSNANMKVVREITVEVVDRLAEQQGQRAGVPAATLFPVWPLVRARLLAAETPQQPTTEQSSEGTSPSSSGSNDISSNGEGRGASSGKAAGASTASLSSVDAAGDHSLQQSAYSVSSLEDAHAMSAEAVVASGGGAQRVLEPVA